MSAPPDEASLAELLQCIKGTGCFAQFGPYLHTCPESKERNNVALHAGCLELERRGLVRRKVHSPSHWSWE